jgi:hypothetical protein
LAKKHDENIALTRKSDPRHQVCRLRRNASVPQNRLFCSFRRDRRITGQDHFFYCQHNKKMASSGEPPKCPILQNTRISAQSADLVARIIFSRQRNISSTIKGNP